VQAAPPIARTGQREVGKHAVAGPDRSDVGRPVSSFYEHILFGSGVIGSVAVVGIFLDVQVRDEDGVNALRAKVQDHFFEGGKLVAVDGEGGVFVLVVDVKVDGIQ